MMTTGSWREDLDTAVTAARRESVLESAETLKQIVRRLRQTEDEARALSLVVNATGPFCKKAAVFVFDREQARVLASRGLDEVQLAIDLKQAAAFYSAVETQDPVIAIATETELSKEFFRPAIEGFAGDERVFLFPIVVKGAVVAAIFAMGDVQAPIVEMLAEVTAAHLGSIRQVALVTVPPEPKGSARWEDLSAEQKAQHLRAQRFARLKVSEMRVYHGDAVRRGIRRSDLYLTLKPQIDEAREAYAKEFPGVPDYFYLEVLGNLAKNDDRLLGPLFPGPIV
jgi:hypothetical protein